MLLQWPRNWPTLRGSSSEIDLKMNQATHPLQGKIMTGAEMVVQILADQGVDVIFGYSGGAILPTYDAVFRYNAEHLGEDGSEPMPLIVPANEQGAGFMAAGYARASGKVGVVMVTSGPGATNTVTPVRDSMADSVPLLVISGQVPTPAIGTAAFQEAPVAAIMWAVATPPLSKPSPDIRTFASVTFSTESFTVFASTASLAATPSDISTS